MSKCCCVRCIQSNPKRRETCAISSVRTRPELAARTQVDHRSLNGPMPLKVQSLVAYSGWDSKAHGWEDNFATFSMLLPYFSFTIPACYIIP